MPENVQFESALRYFIDQQGASDTASTQTGIVQQAADVTAHVEGSRPDLFPTLKLTAWRRVISPPSPPGPRPAIAPPPAAQGPRPERMFLVRSRPSNKSAIRMDSLGHTYVISGVWDENTKHPLRVDALGYLELSVTTLPFPSPIPKQGSNRFTADVVVNGTTWNQTKVGLILNFVGVPLDLQFGFIPPPPPDTLIPPQPIPFAEWVFLQGGQQSALLVWEFVVEPFPPHPDDYPLEFVLGPGFGDLVAGELSMNPNNIVLTWNSPADAPSARGTASVTAKSFAPLVTNQQFTVLEDFLNGSVNRQSPPLTYSIKGAGP